MRNSPIPLVVDLDGTLIKTDLLYEALMLFVKQHVFLLPQLLFALLHGKLTFKQFLAKHVGPRFDLLPYDENVLEEIRRAKSLGGRVVLASASLQEWALGAAGYLGLFDEVYGSREVNLTGERKAELLVEIFGEGNFGYIGNSVADLRIWRRSAKIYVVSPTYKLLRKIRTLEIPYTIIPRPKRLFGALIKSLRPHQWVKNILVFVPLFTSHQWFDRTLIIRSLFVFLTFSLCASSIYILNDLLDLESDREHPSKKTRPFASGNSPIIAGLLFAPAMLIFSAWLATYLFGFYYCVVLSLYLGTSLLYSFKLKKTPLVDVFTLSFLYAIRIMAGGVALEIPISQWLILFSIFIFLSLAFIKRYTELQRILGNTEEIKVRGYIVTDLQLLLALGISCGTVASLVIAFYVNNPNIKSLYPSPQLLWGLVPLLLLWISRVWLMTVRGEMHDDPIVFSLKDRFSYKVILGVVIFVLLATLKYDWVKFY